jgi:hypothetical protein
VTDAGTRDTVARYLERLRAWGRGSEEGSAGDVAWWIYRTMGSLAMPGANDGEKEWHQQHQCEM